LRDGEIGRKKLVRAKLAEYFARLQPVRVVMERAAARTTGRACWAARPPGGAACRRARSRLRAQATRTTRLTLGRSGWRRSRRDIRRVPKKTLEQQAVLALHRTAHALGQRTHGHHQRRCAGCCTSSASCCRAASMLG
jgi:hypothetical protein